MENQFIINYLVSKFIDINFYSAVEACEHGDLRTLKYLLIVQPEIDNYHMLMDSACRHGHLKIVKFLLEKGANFKTSNGLQLACSTGRIDIVRFLISNGLVDVTTKGNLSVFWASDMGHLNVVKYLVKHGANALDKSSFLIACENGHLDVVKFLVKKGTNVKVQNNYSLKLAAENGHLDIVKFLVENGANPHARNDGALQEATKGNHLEIVRFFQDLFLEEIKQRKIEATRCLMNEKCLNKDVVGVMAGYIAL